MRRLGCFCSQAPKMWVQNTIKCASASVKLIIFAKKYESCSEVLVELEFFVYLHSQLSTMVRWMSGLVTGLQNRLQRFESASDLGKTPSQALVEGFSAFYAIFMPFFTPRWGGFYFWLALSGIFCQREGNLYFFLKRCCSPICAKRDRVLSLVFCLYCTFGLLCVLIVLLII